MDADEHINCHCEAVTEISRGSSAATPPDVIGTINRTPEGC